jgi:hypothetical protein
MSQTGQWLPPSRTRGGPCVGNAKNRTWNRDRQAQVLEGLTTNSGAANQLIVAAIGQVATVIDWKMPF